MELMQENGIGTPTGYIASTPEEAENAYRTKLNNNVEGACSCLITFCLQYEFALALSLSRWAHISFPSHLLVASFFLVVPSGLTLSFLKETRVKLIRMPLLRHKYYQVGGILVHSKMDSKVVYTLSASPKTHIT